MDKEVLKNFFTCRLCLNSVSAAYNVFMNCKDAVKFNEKVNEIFRIELDESTETNSTVCQVCFIDVCKFYTYFQQVLKNNEQLLSSRDQTDDYTILKSEEGNVENDVIVEDAIYYDVIEEENAQILLEMEVENIKDTKQVKETLEEETPSSQSSPIPPVLMPEKVSRSSRKRNNPQIDLPEHLKKRISKAKGDAKIKEFLDIICTICEPEQPSFDTFKDMQQHYETEHNTRGYVICCEKKIYRKDRVMDHITIHVDPNAFKCPICNHTSKSKVLLRIHMKQHLPVEEWPFECDKCNQRFVLKSQLTNHEATHLNDEEKKFICDECGKVFALKFVLIKHKLTHSKEKNFFCEICAKSFSSQANLSSHIRQHDDNEKPNPRVQCNDCGQWYKNRQTLRTHEHRHRDKRDHVCKTCGKKCSSKSSLSGHIRYVHTKVGQFQCKLCTKEFRRKPELTEHMARHTGEVLYTCSYCPKTFYSSSNFFAHRKSRHPVEYAALLKKTAIKSS